MIAKVAVALPLSLSLSLKRQFGIFGLVTAEEIDSAPEPPETTPTGKAPIQHLSHRSSARSGGGVSTSRGRLSRAIPATTPAPEKKAPPFESKCPKEELAGMEEQLGKEKFAEILAGGCSLGAE